MVSSKLTRAAVSDSIRSCLTLGVLFFAMKQGAQLVQVLRTRRDSVYWQQHPLMGPFGCGMCKTAFAFECSRGIVILSTPSPFHLLEIILLAGPWLVNCTFGMSTRDDR